MRATKVIQVITSIFSTCIFFAGTVAAQSGGDGRWKAVDYNGSSTFTAVIIVKDGKISEANLSTVCDPDVCKNDTWEESCEVDNFAINKPLTDTSLSCSDWRSMSGSVFGTMTTDGDDKNAGAANLRFLQERDFALFEAEAAKGDGKLSTREFAPRLAELVAKEEKRLADAAAKEKAAKAKKIRVAKEKAAKAKKIRMAEEKAAKAKKIRVAKEKAAKANAEKKKRNAVNAIKAPVDAKQYIADLRNFFKKHPDKVDAMKLAELFVPAQQDIDSGSFTKKGSNFGKLTVFMSRNKAFAAYRESEIKARAIIMEEQKRLALTKIVDGIKTIKLSISKNPLDPNSHSLTKLVKQYEKITGKEPLGTLKSSVLALGTSMTKLGVKPPFAHKVAKTPAAPVKKIDSDVTTNAPQPKAQKPEVAAAPTPTKKTAPTETAQKKAAAKEAAVKVSASAKSIKICLSGTKHSHSPIAGKCSASYEKGDYANAMREWKPLAEQGNASAQYNLSRMYFRGQGVRKHFKTAAKWNKLAAEQGLAAAQFSLGRWYQAKYKHKTALKWFTLAAEQAPLFQEKLGDMYASGKEKSVPKNYKTAVKWYKLAAEQGRANAQYSLGQMYAEGKGVPQNDKTAVKWYKLAAKQGNNFAQFSLGSLYQTKNKHKTAVKWYKLAAEQGFAPAQRQLSRLRYLQEQAEEEARKQEAKRAAEERAAARAKAIRMAEERAAKAKRIRMAKEKAARDKKIRMAKEQAAEDAKEENWLKNVYYQYMSIKNCYEIRKPYAIQYLNTQQMADAKVHIKNLEAWLTKKHNLKSDVEWGRADTQFQKELGKQFRTLKAIPDYNKQMDAFCKMQLNNLMGIQIPGKKKTMKKDF
ncbi:MAG: tetratricopeptide repeat protein [Pseudomonadota bacterium]|nr:tetratricopeptide repeat protein [Pseudomonadota bacterium]